MMVIFTFLVGLASIWYATTIYVKSRSQFIIPYIFCLAVINISLLTAIPEEYIADNQSVIEFSSIKEKLVYLFTILSYIVDFLWIYLLLFTFEKLLKWKVRKVLYRALLAFLILLIALFSYAFLQISKGETSKILSDVNTIILLAFLIVTILVFILIYLKTRSLKGNLLGKYVNQTLLIVVPFWSFYLICSVIKPFFKIDELFLLSQNLSYLSFNIVPLILLNKMSKAFLENAKNEKESPQHLVNLFKEYRISKREQEIIALVRTGKTNKQIAGQLFISDATVKDHIHNIYSKTLVKNRVQLLNLFRETPQL